VRFLLITLLLTVPAFAGVPAKTDVVIIGAGLSGLATAYELKKAHIAYHLLEIQPRVGGRVRTVRYHRPGEPEVSVDAGMEEYWESNPAVALLRELKLPTRGDVALSSLVLGGKLEPLGDVTAAEFEKQIFSADEIAALHAFKTKVAPLVDQLIAHRDDGAAIAPELFALKDQAFGAWVRAQGVPLKTADWIRISIECEIGTSWDRISALDGIAEFHIFAHGDGEKSVRVNGGNDQFTDALARSVGLANISVNERVNRVASKDGTVAVTYLDTSTNRSGVIRARAVVSTVPLFRLFEVQFDPALSPKKREAITTMSWGAYFKAHVFLPRSAEKFWTAKSGSVLPLLSDSPLGVVYDGNPDEKAGPKILSLLTFGDAAEKFNMQPLDATRAEITAGLDKLWPGLGAEVGEIEFYRYHPRAIAAWPPGRSRFDALSDEIRRPENGVYLAGDFTESSHSDGAFISAHRAARAIVAALGRK
jgi:monoamine oxidase